MEGSIVVKDIVTFLKHRPKENFSGHQNRFLHKLWSMKKRTLFVRIVSLETFFASTNVLLHIYEAFGNLKNQKCQCDKSRIISLLAWQ